MTYLVDANVLSEPTKPEPKSQVVDWLTHHESEIAVDPIILGEIRFGSLLLPQSKRRRRLEDWFSKGVERNPLFALGCRGRVPVDSLVSRFACCGTIHADQGQPDRSHGAAS